jgi:hypothetical protein
MIENHLANLALDRMTSNASSPAISIISLWMSDFNTSHYKLLKLNVA